MSDQPEPLPALLPCPFCDDQPAEYDAAAGSDHEVSCSNDDCSVTVCVFAPTRTEAIARWNTRAPVSPEQLVAPGRFVMVVEDHPEPGQPRKTIAAGFGPRGVDWSTPAAQVFKTILSMLEGDPSARAVQVNDHH